MRQEAARLRQIDAGRDRGMRRRAQEQQLRDAEPQHVVDDRGARRQRRVEAIADQRVDLAEPAQHGGDEQPGEGAVAHRQIADHRMVLDRVVERPLAAQHRADQVEGHLPRVRRRGVARRTWQWRFQGVAGGGKGSVVRFCRSHHFPSFRMLALRANAARAASFRKFCAGERAAAPQRG